MTKNQIEQKVYQDLHAKEAYLQKLESTTIDASSYITGKKCGYYAYGTPHSGTITTVTVAGTYYEAQVELNTVVEEDFSLGEDGIEYIGEKTQYFIINGCATICGDSNSLTTHIAISINDVIQTCSISGNYLKFSGEEANQVGLCIVELTKGDLVKIEITADIANSQIQFQHAALSIAEFFD